MLAQVLRRLALRHRQHQQSQVDIFRLQRALGREALVQLVQRRQLRRRQRPVRVKVEQFQARRAQRRLPGHVAGVLGGDGAQQALGLFEVLAGGLDLAQRKPELALVDVRIRQSQRVQRLARRGRVQGCDDGQLLLVQLVGRLQFAQFFLGTGRPRQAVGQVGRHALVLRRARQHLRLERHRGVEGARGRLDIAAFQGNAAQAGARGAVTVTGRALQAGACAK